MLGTSHRSQRTPDPAAGESSAPAPRAHLAPGDNGMRGGETTVGRVGGETQQISHTLEQQMQRTGTHKTNVTGTIQLK